MIKNLGVSSDYEVSIAWKLESKISFIQCKRIVTKDVYKRQVYMCIKDWRSSTGYNFL